ncbi:MAG: hypothetical protein V2J26_11675 [Pacificimonas sp.]|nr:hypothetical protein [Pacificimonas sp.]
MIKIISLRPLAHPTIELHFSDGSRGIWSAADIIARETVLTQPLADPAYFARGFIESGALAWPNGLELAGHTLHADLKACGQLENRAA